jgi:holliday junction DNA helicase RuvA
MALDGRDTRGGMRGMIARLSGTVAEVGPGCLVLDVGGVGYLVHASARTLARAGSIGAPAVLLIETYLRQDALTLYGFSDPAERAWFGRLTAVQGVGARAALSILSALSPDDLALAVAAGDDVPLRRADGVGPKIARRVVAELRDKAPLPALGPTAAAPAAQGVQDGDAAAQAVGALVNLGYGRAEAYSAVARAGGDAGPDADAAGLIRGALRLLSS